MTPWHYRLVQTHIRLTKDNMLAPNMRPLEVRLFQANPRFMTHTLSINGVRFGHMNANSRAKNTENEAEICTLPIAELQTLAKHPTKGHQIYVKGKSNEGRETHPQTLKKTRLHWTWEKNVGALI